MPFLSVKESRPSMIHVENLVKTFGEVKAVDGISFEVSAGEIFAFLGPNGAGKTTTIQMLTTLQRPTSGSMRLDGLDPVTQQLQARSRFGIVFQDPSLDVELTAYENMDLHGALYHVPRKVRVDRIHTLLTLFELWDRRDSTVKTFSGGMKRRLEIARGLLHTPKILFLDEPTLGLDPQSRNLRGALIGLSQFGVVTNLSVLAVFASGFLVLGAWAFSRIQI
jgi:ABC-2 type transport system ATP-binding protein